MQYTRVFSMGDSFYPQKIKTAGRLPAVSSPGMKGN
jgi:hypothetical protein